MNRFQIPSPILEIQVNTLNDFIYEHVTTAIPFEILTTEEVREAETRENSGLMMIIYGIGGVLIFLVICTICYRCVMPEESDEAYARFMRRNQEDLDERIRIANLERQRNQNDVESPLIPENAPVTLESLDRTEGIRGTDRIIRDLQRIEEGPFSGIIGAVGTAIRSHTTPKQLFESQQNTHPKIENSSTAELHKLGQVIPGEKYEERVDSWEYLTDIASPINESNQFSQDTDFININLDEKGSNGIAILETSATESPDYERRSQSFPTSPDIIRRRYSTLEATPRRSSSLR